MVELIFDFRTLERSRLEMYWVDIDYDCSGIQTSILTMS